MYQSTVAVVLPVYNRPNVVLEALQSVLEQSYRPKHVAIVDDGSTDHTADAIQNWLDTRGTELNAELIRQENQGVATARNRGAQTAEACDLLAFLDSDDIWPTDYLARAAQAFDADANVVAATADRLNVDESTGVRKLKSCAWVTDHTTSRIFLDGPAGLSNTVYRAAPFWEIGGYDPAMLCGEEDYHMHLCMSLRGRWAHLPGEPVTYRQHTVDVAKPDEQLSRRCNDRRMRLAHMLQRFVDEQGGAQAIRAEDCRRRLTRAWYSAGRQLHQIGRTSEARDCFARALRLSPWHVRARLRQLTLRGS